MQENKDYELIPSTGDPDSWTVRILTGEFNETVFQYLAIKVDEEQISFNFDVIEAPSTYIVEDNQDLHKTVGEILIDIIESSLDK